MNTFRRVLPFGCALAVVCLSAVQIAAGQSMTSQSAASPSVAGQNAANESGSAIPNRVTQSVDGKERVTLKGNVHPFAQSASSLGATTDSLPMERILLVLKRSDAQEAALGNLVEAQQDKSSPNYHQWLSPEDFGKQFGPSDSDIQAVTDWLEFAGIPECARHGWAKRSRVQRKCRECAASFPRADGKFRNKRRGIRGEYRGPADSRGVGSGNFRHRIAA